ncbi:MAG: hypothetical protein U0836_11335 [Pirellulales bacterium]
MRLLHAILLLAALGCGGEPTEVPKTPAAIPKKPEIPQDAVRVVIVNAQESDGGKYHQALQDAIEGPSHRSTMSRVSDGTTVQITVQLSPVSDPHAFAKKISFGKVVSVQDRIVTVDAVSK